MKDLLVIDQMVESELCKINWEKSRAGQTANGVVPR